MLIIPSSNLWRIGKLRRKLQDSPKSKCSWLQELIVTHPLLLAVHELDIEFVKFSDQCFIIAFEFLSCLGHSPCHEPASNTGPWCAISSSIVDFQPDHHSS